MAFFVQNHLNSITTSSREEKHPNSCAEGATRAFQAEKGIISCAERDTHRLPRRKTPQILRGRCPGSNPGRKRYLFRRRTGYPPPPEQKNTPIHARKVLRNDSRQKKVSFPARKIANILHKCPQHHYFSVFGNFAFFKKN